jgi:hypothetical protein
MTPASDYPIEEIELGVRAYNIMKRMGVNTCSQLAKVSVQDLNAWTLRTGVAVGLPAAMQIAEAQQTISEWGI